MRQGLGRLLIVVACFVLQNPVLGQTQLRVIVSIKPVHSIMAGLMQGVVKPELIIARGNPFTYQLTKKQLVDLGRADLVVWVGPELEKLLVEPLRDVAAKTKVLALLDNDRLKILPARGNGALRDPFLWLDSRNALIVAEELAKVLMNLDPDHASIYERNRARVLEGIAQLDRQFEFGYKKVSSGKVYLYHDTQQYFQQSYGMQHAGSVALMPGQTPKIEDLLRVPNDIKASNAKCLLTEVDLPALHLSVLTDERSIAVRQLDSLGSRIDPGPDLFTALMRANFKAIQGCFEPEADQTELPPLMTAVKTADRMAGRYILQNHLGETITNGAFDGMFQLIAFGYTSCPDICPTSLSTISKVMDLLGEDGARVQPLFITVDPDRDTVAVMRRYISYFHPRLMGLTGSASMIERAAVEYGVRYEKVLDPDRPSSDYLMDHSSGLLLFGPDRRFLVKFASGIAASDMAARIADFL